MSPDSSARVARLETLRFWTAALLAAAASLSAIPLILADAWVLLLGGTASALNPELFGPNNAPYYLYFWAPPIMMLAACLLMPWKRGWLLLILLGFLPLLLALANLLFFLKPSGPVYVPGGMVHVLRADGTPAEGAEIWVSDPPAGQSLAGQTQRDGSFRLRGVTLVRGELHLISVNWQGPGAARSLMGFHAAEIPEFPVTIRLSETP